MEKKYYLLIIILLCFVIGCGGGVNNSNSTNSHWEGTAQFFADGKNPTPFTVTADFKSFQNTLEGSISDEFGQVFFISGTLEQNTIILTANTTYGLISLTGTTENTRITLSGNYLIGEIEGSVKIELFGDSALQSSSEISVEPEDELPPLVEESITTETE
ncbi:hypothetical protein ACFL1T_00830 [Chlamydiota bacterium]